MTGERPKNAFMGFLFELCGPFPLTGAWFVLRFLVLGEATELNFIRAMFL